jgi:hypothetical protein
MPKGETYANSIISIKYMISKRFNFRMAERYGVVSMANSCDIHERHTSNRSPGRATTA